MVPGGRIRPGRGEEIGLEVRSLRRPIGRRLPQEPNYTRAATTQRFGDPVRALLASAFRRFGWGMGDPDK